MIFEPTELFNVRLIFLEKIGIRHHQDKFPLDLYLDIQLYIT
jgi:hypothetical protein